MFQKRWSFFFFFKKAVFSKKRGRLVYPLHPCFDLAYILHLWLPIFLKGIWKASIGYYNRSAIFHFSHIWLLLATFWLTSVEMEWWRTAPFWFDKILCMLHARISASFKTQWNNLLQASIKNPLPFLKQQIGQNTERTLLYMIPAAGNRCSLTKALPHQTLKCFILSNGYMEVFQFIKWLCGFPLGKSWKVKMSTMLPNEKMPLSHFIK